MNVMHGYGTLTLSHEAARERVCYLETYGRVSGRPHEIEIWFAVAEQDGRTLYLLSGGRDRSDWVKNIRRNPGVYVRIGTTRYRGTGRLIAADEPQDRRAREVVAAKYQAWQPGRELSQWARESLAVEIRLDAECA